MLIHLRTIVKSNEVFLYLKYGLRQIDWAQNDFKISKNKICFSILPYQNTAFFLGLRYGSLFQNVFLRYAGAWEPVLTDENDSSQIENDFPYVPQ